MVANRVRFDLVGDVASTAATPVYALPEIDLLMAPTVGQVAAACDGEIIAGDAELLGREALHLTVAAMTLPNLMERIEDGAVLITPGDRADVLLAALFAHASKELPSPAGIVLTGGLRPPRHVPQAARRLPDDAAGDPDRARHVRGGDAGRRARGRDRAATRRARSPRRSRVFEEYVDGDDLLSRVDVSPLGGGHAADVRVRAARPRAGGEPQHIVLPEGTDERVLRAAEILLRRRVVELTLLGPEDEVRGAACRLGAGPVRRAPARPDATRRCASASRPSTPSAARTRA